MGTLISILIVIVAILLILIVIIQNPKGGGLSSSFASSNQVMGVRKTADFLEKATWTLAIALLGLSLIATPYSKSTGTTSNEPQTTESATRKVASEKGISPVAPPPAAPNGAQNNVPAPTDAGNGK